MDFQREKDAILNPNTRLLPIPNATYDVFYVKGQGIGGTVRAYRNDLTVFSDPEVKSSNNGLGAGLD